MPKTYTGVLCESDEESEIVMGRKPITGGLLQGI